MSFRAAASGGRNRAACCSVAPGKPLAAALTAPSAASRVVSSAVAASCAMDEEKADRAACAVPRLSALRALSASSPRGAAVPGAAAGA